jgi:glutaredoxin 1
MRAKSLCETRNFPFTWIDMVTEGLSKADVAEKIGRPVHTVPQILVGDEYIGGCDEFFAFVRSQETAGTA